MTDDDPPVIEATGLTYTYPDGTTAVDGVDLTIERGERIALLGPNGAGKSTLLGLLGGLVDPDRGSVRYFGADCSADAVRDRVSVLTQDPADYLFNPTIEEDLAYGPAQQGYTTAEINRRVETIAAQFSLEGLLDKPPFRLSGGEKRRAALASALAIDPDVVLLDEPTSNVDATHRDRILARLAALSAAGVTILTSTPATELVPHVADRVVLLAADGTIAADAPTRTVLTDTDLLATCGLEAPQVVRLFADSEPIPLTVAEAKTRLGEESH